MKRNSCSRLLLFASFIAGSFSAPASDADLFDKDLSLIDRTIIEEILNSRRPKPADNSWYDSVRRNSFWIPAWSTPGMGYGCVCSANPYLPMGAPPSFFGNPFNLANPSQYQYTELNAANSLPSSYHPTQSTELHARDSTSGVPLTHQPHTPVEESIAVAAQRKGLIQAIRSRFKAEIAAIAAKISPPDPSPPSTPQQSTTPPSVTVRPSSAAQRSPPSQPSSTAYQARSPKTNTRQ